MASRHRSRERALQILYLWDMRGQPVEEAAEEYYTSLLAEQGEAGPERDPFTDELVNGVSLRREEIDAVIREHSENWRLERMPAVDRNLIRLAVYELRYVGTPGPVVVHEAIQLAERFSGESSVPFINGILDAVSRNR